MTTSEFRDLLRAALHSNNSTSLSLTLTDIPDDQDELRLLLDEAVRIADETSFPLTEIQIGQRCLEDLGATYSNVRIDRNAQNGTVRLCYQAIDRDSKVLS